jgi:signal transduction histidine kinase
MALRPQALVGTRAERPWALLWALLVVLIVASDFLLPRPMSTGALIVLPVLAASWMLGCRLFLAVLVLAVSSQVASALLGDVHPVVAAARTMSIAVVALVGRVAGLGWAEMRRAQQDEVVSLLRGSRLLGRSLDEEGVAAEAVRVACGTVAKSSGAGRRAVLLRVADRRVSVVAGCDESGTVLPARLEVPLPDMPTAARDTLRNGRAGVVAVSKLEPALRDLAALPGADAWALARVPVGGETFGLLGVASGDPAGFQAEDLRLLDGIAQVAGLAIGAGMRHAQVAQLYAQAELAQREASSYSDRLQLAIEAAEDIGCGKELADVTERVLRRAVDAVGADRGSITRMDGEEMLVEHDYDPLGGPALVSARWKLADSQFALEAIRTRRPVRGSFAERLPSARPGLGLKHVLHCPLTVEGEVVGLLGLGRRGDEEFTEADLLTLQPFASLAGLLLRNARQLAEARQVGQAKSTFLNLAAHELRTPLAVIKGYLSLLEDGTYAVPERTREEAVPTLVAKAEELESLVEVLLTTARLDVGGLPRSAVELDLVEAVREAVERLVARARLEMARVEVELPDHPVLTRADRDHVARILDNLLNNALSYSSLPATVTITLRPGDPVAIAVRDRGRGIPTEHQARVFEPFYRLDGSARGLTPGLGLGLALSRDLAQMNDGSLVLETSTPGRGSVFVLRLPPAL